jgi:hypothetical protein
VIVFGLTNLGNQYALYAVAGFICLLAFVGLILSPALSSHGRVWEKAAAGFLAVFVLATLVAVGIGIGLLIVLHYPEISDFVNGK